MWLVATILDSTAIDNKMLGCQLKCQVICLLALAIYNESTPCSYSCRRHSADGTLPFY